MNTATATHTAFGSDFVRVTISSEGTVRTANRGVLLGDVEDMKRQGWEFKPGEC